MEKKDFEHVVGGHRDRWLRMGVGALGNSDDAHDALQETLLRLWVVRGRLASADDAVRLGNRIMKNECVNIWRRRRRCQEAVAVADMVEECTHDGLERNEREELLRWAVGHLGEQARMLLHLHLYEGMSLDDIAEGTGKTKGSIKTMISRAKRQITQWIRTRNS